MRKIASIALALLVVAGCSSNQTAEPPIAGGTTAPVTQPQAAEPRTEAAVRRVAQEEVDSFAAGEYGAAWDLWSARGKKAISRPDYERLFELCPSPVDGVRFTIEKITMAPGGNSAKVRYSLLATLVSFDFVYEAGRWRFVPAPEAMREYRIGDVKKIAAKARAEGRCGE
jgi:hypothetical protein